MSAELDRSVLRVLLGTAGVSLPEIATALGVQPAPVTRSLRRLAADGIVTLSRGTRVQKPTLRIFQALSDLEHAIADLRGAAS